MRIFLRRVTINRPFIALHSSDLFSYRQIRGTKDSRRILNIGFHSISRMCQGHEEPVRETSAVSESTVSVPAQTEQTRRQKAKNNKKQQKQQQNSRSQTPNPLPTYEIIKNGSADLAKGIPYVDVFPYSFLPYNRRIVTCL